MRYGDGERRLSSGHAIPTHLGALVCTHQARGLDYQFAGGFSIGLQGDYAWMDAVGPRGVSQPTMNKNSDAFTRVSASTGRAACRACTEALASVTVRIGYALSWRFSLELNSRSTICRRGDLPVPLAACGKKIAFLRHVNGGGHSGAWH